MCTEQAGSHIVSSHLYGYTESRYWGIVVSPMSTVRPEPRRRQHTHVRASNIFGSSWHQIFLRIISIIWPWGRRRWPYRGTEQNKSLLHILLSIFYEVTAAAPPAGVAVTVAWVIWDWVLHQFHVRQCHHCHHYHHCQWRLIETDRGARRWGQHSQEGKFLSWRKCLKLRNTSMQQKDLI